MGITNMQGTSGYIEYIGEKKIKKYSCRNCFNYVDGVCKVKNIALEYINGNGKLCSNFDPIDKFENRKYKRKTNKINKIENIGSIKNKDISNVIINAQKNRRIGRNKKFVGSKSKVYICDSKNKSKVIIINMNDKNLDRDLFNRLLDKQISSSVLYKNVIYLITQIF